MAQPVAPGENQDLLHMAQPLAPGENQDLLHMAQPGVARARPGARAR